MRLVIMHRLNSNIQRAALMGHEISQFDIQDRQLLAGNPRPRAGIVTNLGEAKITRTIFGRAKVRVVHEHDRKRRAWLLAILMVTAIAAAAWQGWIIFQKMQNVAPPVPLSERIQVSAPIFRPAHIAPAESHPSRRESESLMQTEIDGLLSGPLPRHPPGWPPSEKPVAAKPSMANQAQAQAQAQTQTQTTPQPATTAPTAAVPIAHPLVKKDAAITLPAGSVPHPVSAQD
jgi:hypothetical protein